MRNGELYRDENKGKLGGVCAGLADYFGFETWLVRILTLSVFLLGGGGVVIVGYIAAWFILDKKPSVTESKAPINAHRGFAKNVDTEQSNTSYTGKGFRNSYNETHHKVEVKSKVWQSGLPPRQAFNDIKQQYSVVENKLRRIESYVTSTEFQLNREINRL